MSLRACAIWRSRTICISSSSTAPPGGPLTNPLEAEPVSSQLQVSSFPFGTGTGTAKVPFVWVGNPATQCPGLCAWPYALPQYGPPGPPLSPPNGEPATDGMIVNLALLLAGTVTNPFGTGYFQGDPDAPLEAGSACQGIYGAGSYPGYPGQLLQEKESGASYNALGANNRRFL